MIAAIYARKSTDQAGVSDDARSVTRQAAQAEAFAAERGWRVEPAHVYVDDGVSGAEFDSRPGFLRLMNALGPHGAPFDVLIMSEESRLGREQIETAYALKRLISAGVRVWFYLEGRERTLDSPTDKVMLSLTTFADEMERDRARQRTYDALERKARAGHVTGGRVFGYDNVTIVGPDGHRSHVERRINEAEAVVVRKIFEQKASGWGYTRIAKQLNVDGVPTPRSQQGRPRGWSASAVLEVLRRDLYRGVITWNKTRKRNRWGAKEVKDRPAGEWLTIDAPHLRIVDETTWLAVERERALRQAATPVAAQRTRDRGAASRYVLTGFLRCATCGATMSGTWRGSSERRWFGYACLANTKRGSAICTNNTVTPVGILDRAVVDAILAGALDPGLLDAVVERLQAQLAAVSKPVASVPTGRARELERRIRNLTDAIAQGEPPAALLEALRLAERDLAQARASAAAAGGAALTPDLLQAAVAAVRATLEGWRTSVTREPGQLRPLLSRVIVGTLTVTPNEGTTRHRGVTFAGEAHLAGLFRGAVEPDLLKWRPHRDPLYRRSPLTPAAPRRRPCTGRAPIWSTAACSTPVGCA